MLKKLLLIASFISFASLIPAAHAADDAAAVTAAAETLRTLMLAPDQGRLSAIVADELSYGHSGGKLDTKTSFIADLLSGASHFLTIEIKDQTVRVVGDVALVRHVLTGNTADKGQPPGTVNLKILQVWQKQGGEWKLLARQAVRVPQ